ncbi:MAG: hypothetical protein ISQ78_04855 [Candidatus Actinomarina sp.]|nr:hypothetical protein [Candidatus Actinomarina sp.]
MAGSDKRLTVAQRKKIQVRGRKNKGRDAVLHLPGAAAGAARDTAKQALNPRPPQMREKQDPKKLAGQAGTLAASAIPVVGPLAKAGQAARGAAKAASKASKTAKKTDGLSEETGKQAASNQQRVTKKASSDDAFAAIVARVAAEGARQSGRKVPARGSAAEKKTLAEAAKRVKKDVKSIRASGSPAKDRVRRDAGKKESGVGAYSAIRLAQAAARNASGTVKTSKGRPAKKKTIVGPYGEDVLRTKASAKGQSRTKTMQKQGTKKAIKGGMKPSKIRVKKRGR